MRYQHSWKEERGQEIPEKSQTNLEETIHHALELGIHHFETARGYGTSETQLGKILPSLPREKIIVQTKVVPFDDPEKYRKGFERSLSNLGLDYVDLLSLHGVNTQELLDLTLRRGGCLEIARQFQAEGRVKFIGFSTHAPTDVIVRAIESGEFDYVNLHWYYIFQNNWPAIEAAARQDMGVFIISPSDKGGHLYEPPRKLVDLCDPLSPMVFNDLFCLSHPEVHTLSIGASRPGDFDEHVKTVPLLDRAEELLPPVISRLEEAMIEAMGTDWTKTWNVGLPTQDRTPENINIPVILWLRNLALSYDMIAYGKARYNLLGSGGHWFPGKKAENMETLDLGDCLADSPYAEKIPSLLREAHDLLFAEPEKRLSES